MFPVQKMLLRLTPSGTHIYTKLLLSPWVGGFAQFASGITQLHSVCIYTGLFQTAHTLLKVRKNCYKG